MQTLKYVNLTPHIIRLRIDDGDLEIPPSGEIARVETGPIEIASVSGLPVLARKYRSLAFGDLVGLPDSEQGVAYIVSLPCMDAAQRLGRDDVYAPDTSQDSVIRDDAGQVYAVTRLVRAYWPSSR